MKSCHPRFILLLLFCFLFSFAQAQEITKKRGKFKVRHPNGKVMAAGKVRNYKKQGLWKSWDDKGVLQNTITYVNDTANGPYTEYYPDGNISTQGTYRNFKRHGNWKMYSSSGVLVGEQNFVDGFADGPQTYWYENGQKREYIRFAMSWTLYRQAWYPNGKTKLVESFNKGLAEGRWVYYPDPETATDTFPLWTDEYHEGDLHGVHTAYAGSVKTEEYHYSKGKFHGTVKKWGRNGQLEMEEIYDEGYLNGESRYYRNGMIIRSAKYSRGKKHGTEVDYDRDGDTLKMSWYRKGEVDSVISFHPNGRKATASITWRFPGTNLEDGTYTEWDTAGVLLLHGQYYMQAREGDWKTYYPNGKVKSVTPYLNGVMTGLFTKWYPNGKKMIQYHIFQEGVNTHPDVWNEKGKPLKMGSPEYNEIVEGNKPGEMYSDPSQYKRSVIGHRVEEISVGDDEVIRDAPDLVVDEGEMALVPDSGEVFMITEVMPSFPGGDTAMRNFINKNIKYPPICREMAIEGTVYIRYVVEKDGSISNVTVLKGINGGEALSEALRVVSLFPVHTPGKMYDQPVRCYMTIPVRFRVH